MMESIHGTKCQIIEECLRKEKAALGCAKPEDGKQ